MIVIALRNTTKIVKGSRYEVHCLYNSSSNKVYIKGLGGYNVSVFSDTNGNPLPKIDIPPTADTSPKINFYEIKKGDIIVCNSDNYKTLIKGAKYKIEDTKEEKVEYTMWNGTKAFRSYKKIKFEGITRWFDFNTWRFRPLTSQEVREMSLAQVLDGIDPEVIKTDKFRKIDHSENKDKDLLFYLSKSIFDRNRNSMDIIEWTEKIGNKMGIKRNDYDSLLDLSLREIIKKFEN